MADPVRLTDDPRVKQIREALALHRSMAICQERPTAKSRAALEYALAALDGLAADLEAAREALRPFAEIEVRLDDTVSVHRWIRIRNIEAARQALAAGSVAPPDGNTT